MTLKKSIYSGGKRSFKCEACNAPLPHGYKMKTLKCRRCTEKMAKEIEEEFSKNIDFETSQAILRIKDTQND